MHLVHADSPVSRPRWDGQRVTFDIDDGEGRIRCAISHAALLDIAGRTRFRPSLLGPNLVTGRTA